MKIYLKQDTRNRSNFFSKEEKTKMFSLFVVLAAVRFHWAWNAPIMDCDETFNYWEPVHYLMYGSGLQTWE